MKWIIFFFNISTIFSLICGEWCPRNVSYVGNKLNKPQNVAGKPMDLFKIQYKVENVCCDGYIQEEDKCISKCGKGFKWNGKCDPVCNTPCPEFSECTAPDNCTAIDGYKKENNVFKPVCSKVCPEFFECSAPEKCTYIDGFSHWYENKYLLMWILIGLVCYVLLSIVALFLYRVFKPLHKTESSNQCVEIKVDLKA